MGNDLGRESAPVLKARSVIGVAVLLLPMVIPLARFPVRTGYQ